MTDPLARSSASVTVGDLAQFAQTFADLDNPEVMRQAWPTLRHTRSWIGEEHQDQVGEPVTNVTCGEIVD